MQAPRSDAAWAGQHDMQTAAPSMFRKEQLGEATQPSAAPSSIDADQKPAQGRDASKHAILQPQESTASEAWQISTAFSDPSSPLQHHDSTIQPSPSADLLVAPYLAGAGAQAPLPGHDAAAWQTHQLTIDLGATKADVTRLSATVRFLEEQLEASQAQVQKLEGAQSGAAAAEDTLRQEIKSLHEGLARALTSRYAPVVLPCLVLTLPAPVRASMSASKSAPTVAGIAGATKERRQTVPKVPPTVPRRIAS